MVLNQSQEFFHVTVKCDLCMKTDSSKGSEEKEKEIGLRELWEEETSSFQVLR